MGNLFNSFSTLSTPGILTELVPATYLGVGRSARIHAARRLGIRVRDFPVRLLGPSSNLCELLSIVTSGTTTEGRKGGHLLLVAKQLR